MKKLRQRVPSFILMVCICCSFFVSINVSAETTSTDINKVLLESLLNERSWVIDTIINDDLSTNPHAIVNDISGSRSLMRTALDQYQNENDPNYNKAYSLMVDTLNVWYNKGDYAADVADGVTEWAADVLEFLGGSDSAVAMLRGSADSAKTMHYDSILQEVLKADYTASNGQTLSGSDSQLVFLRKLSDGAGALRDLASASKSISGLDHKTAETTAAYANEVLIPAAESYEKVLTNTAKLTNKDISTKEQAILDLSKALGMAVVYDSVVVKDENSGKVVDLAPSYLLDDTTKELIDVNANTAKFASNTIDSYLYIASIQTQKQSVAGVMNRTASHLGSGNTSQLLHRYSRLIEDAANNKTKNYEYITTMLRNSGALNEFVEKKTSDALKGVATRFIPAYNDSIIPSAFASATGVIGTATYLADSVTGLKDTCTKTLELKNLNQLITYFKKTYQQDLANYKNNPTDENAARVLDDLEFIQRMRLRGETIAYKMTRGQLNSWIGKLLAGGSDEMLTSYYDSNYQRHIDAIIGASITPFTTDSFTVRNGETVFIMTDPNGITYADYTKTDGKSYKFAECEYRFANGITVTKGGTLNIFANSGAPVSYIINNGGNVNYSANSIKIQEYTQNSGNLTVAANANYSIPELSILGGTISATNGSTIICDTLTTSGTSTLSNVVLNVQNNATFGGKLQATVNAYGNITGSSGTVDNLNICGTTAQDISGGFKVDNLVFNNPKGVTLSGAVFVSGSVKNTATKIKNSKNICVVNDGKISGNYFLGDITFQSAKLTDYAEIDGNLFLSSGASEIAGLKVNKFIQQTSGSLIVNGTVNAESDVYLYNLTQNSGTFNVKGNINSGGSSSNSKVSFNLLNFNGKLPQSVNREIHVNNFYYNNTNREKVTLNSPMYVYGSLSLKSSLFNNDTNVYLCGSFANKEKYVGNLTLYNFSSEMPKVYEGNLIINNFNSALSETHTGDVSFKGTNNISSIKDFKGNLSITSGTTTLDNPVAFNIYGTFSNSGTLNLSNCNKVNIDGTLSNGGAVNLKNCQGKIDHLTTSGTVNYTDSSVQLGTISQSSGNINLTNTNVKVTGAVTATNFTIDQNSQINVIGDISAKGTLSGDGIINLYGNYNGTGTCSVSSLNLCGKFPQTIGGGFSANNIVANEKSKVSFTNLSAKNITVKNNATVSFDGAATIDDLYLEKDSTVAINKEIVINNGYHNGGATVSGINNTSLNKILSDTTFTEDTIYTNDIVLLANITIDGCTVTMSKKLNATKGNITIINGGKLVINKEATLNCGTISVSDKSSLTFNGKSTFSSGTIKVSNESSLILKGLPTFNGVSSVAIDESSAMECRRLLWAPSLTNLTVNGNLLLKFGAYLPKTTVSGSGTINLYGDFNVSSGKVNKIGNFNILGKLPQTITGANIKFYNLNINNPTVTTFSSEVFYSGDYVVNKGTVNGTVTYEEEVAE